MTQFKGKTRQEVYNEGHGRGYAVGFRDGYKKKDLERSESIAALLEKAHEDDIQVGWDARKHTEKMSPITNFWDSNLALVRSLFFQWYEPLRASPYASKIYSEREETPEDAAAWRAFEAGWAALARELNWKLEREEEEKK